MLTDIGCIFCNGVDDDSVVDSTKHHLIYKDKYPVTPGHLLVIPKRHFGLVCSYFPDEWSDLWKALERAQRLSCDGSDLVDFNIGVNDGTAAGQTIHHCHWHVIPRKYEDGGLPCGVRNVFPGVADYRKDLTD